jgi:hypothetical protein
MVTLSSNATYVLLSCPRSRQASQKECNKLVAHLAAYTTQQVSMSCCMCHPCLQGA